MLQRKLSEKQKTSPLPLGFCPVKKIETSCILCLKRNSIFFFPRQRWLHPAMSFFQNIVEVGGALKLGFFFKDDFLYAWILCLSIHILSVCLSSFMPPVAILGAHTNAPYLPELHRFRRLRRSGLCRCRPSARRRR